MKYKLVLDIETDSENILPILDTINKTIKEKLVEQIKNTRIYPTLTTIEDERKIQDENNDNGL